jgi:hypothetical protein
MKKLFLALLIIAAQAQMLAQKPKIVASDKTGWHKIGETTVDFKTETDEILVIGANRFKSLKIKVTDAPINLVSIDIDFDKGDRQSVTIGQEIKSPGETRVIPLKGNSERNVQKVTFRYKTVSSSTDKKAHVELWGLKS